MAPIQNHLLMENAMSVSLSIKNVPEVILERLRARAERNHRSLQKELLAIIEAAVIEEQPEITVDELVEYVRTLGLSTRESVTDWIRELRDGR